MIKVIFYNRDFSGRLPLPADLNFTVDSYSNNQIGGAERAKLRAAPTSDRFDLRKLLRCPVEIEGTDGNIKWFGFVNRVNIPNGDIQRVGVGLDNLSNYIVFAYADGDTASASDTASITEYGQKEIRLTDNNATQAQAEQGRDLYLADHQEPRMEFEFSGGSNEIIIDCYGWFSTLGWQYYANSDNANVENTTQISDIVTASGQFFAGTTIDDVSNFDTNEFRDGHSTALTYVNQLLNGGTDSIRPLLATVDRNRYLRVYERPAEPPTENVKYVMTRDGQLETDTGVLVPDEDCTVAVWCRLQEFSDFPPFFIERADYDARNDKTTYTPAGAFEPVRLARYIASVVSGQSSGSTNPYTPYLPIADHTHPPKPCLHRTEYLGTTGITVVKYVTIASAPAAARNMTYNGLSYFTPTTVSSNPAWKILVAGVYWINLWIQIEVDAGTATDGNVGVAVFTGSGAGGTYLFETSNNMGFATGGSGPYFADTIAFKARLPTVNDYLSVWVVNGTDATSLKVTQVEMIATFERAV